MRKLDDRTIRAPESRQGQALSLVGSGARCRGDTFQGEHLGAQLHREGKGPAELQHAPGRPVRSDGCFAVRALNRPSAGNDEVVHFMRQRA